MSSVQPSPTPEESSRTSTGVPRLSPVLSTSKALSFADQMSTSTSGGSRDWRTADLGPDPFGLGQQEGSFDTSGLRLATGILHSRVTVGRLGDRARWTVIAIWTLTAACRVKPSVVEGTRAVFLVALTSSTATGIAGAPD